ncbi:hypothetical protein BgAZ_108760 [Babesia gibsoni]|uniref:VPS9 domain-containing protein n=1 Tax=Babesia gibsoni TaxID=33632 RepID=A0AAD8USI5_BABGI|nr:hypothetical protein BgAZ_108760 [Babesia gibsoni]
MIDEISANALMCVLKNTHEDLYRTLFNQDEAPRLILVPVAHSLINVQISQQVIVYETEVPNLYLNLHGQAIEISGGKVTTSFGFKNHISANIIRDDKIHDTLGSVRVCLISDYLMHSTSRYKDIVDLDLEDTPAIINKWCQNNAEFNDALYGCLTKFENTFVMVPGYESETCGILCSYVENAVSIYSANRNEEINSTRNSISEVILNFVFMHLYDYIMGHFKRTYHKEEEIIQNRILKLRKEMNLNSTLNLLDVKRQASNYNLVPSCESLKMMSEAKLPEEKLKHLATSIQLNKPGSKDESVSFFILTMVAGGITDALANYAFIHMYSGAKFVKHKIVSKHLEAFKGGIQFLLD